MEVRINAASALNYRNRTVNTGGKQISIPVLQRDIVSFKGEADYAVTEENYAMLDVLTNYLRKEYNSFPKNLKNGKIKKVQEKDNYIKKINDNLYLDMIIRKDSGRVDYINIVKISGNKEYRIESDFIYGKNNSIGAVIMEDSEIKKDLQFLKRKNIFNRKRLTRYDIYHYTNNNCKEEKNWFTEILSNMVNDLGL